MWPRIINKLALDEDATHGYNHKQKNATLFTNNPTEKDESSSGYQQYTGVLDNCSDILLQTLNAKKKSIQLLHDL